MTDHPAVELLRDTMSDNIAETDGFKLGFDFARAMRRPEVRERLKLLGFDGSQGDRMMVTFDDEAFMEACQRAPVDARRTLLVAPDVESPGGWWMGWAKEVER